MKIGLIAVVAIAVVAICNINRAAFGTLAGLPWAIPIVLAALGAWTLLLQRTPYGRYVYAIGGNAEAARRAGIKVASVRTWAFVLCSLTAGIGGLLYASYLGGVLAIIAAWIFHIAVKLRTNEGTPGGTAKMLLVTKVDRGGSSHPYAGY